MITDESTGDFAGSRDRTEGPVPLRDAVATRDGHSVLDAAAECRQRERPGPGHDDFHFGLAIAKTVQSVRVAGNFGFGILADPTRGDRQNDVLDYGISVARAVAPGAEIVGEFNGRLNTRSGEAPPGTESRSLDARRRAVHARSGPVRRRAGRRRHRIAIRPGGSRPASPGCSRGSRYSKNAGHGDTTQESTKKSRTQALSVLRDLHVLQCSGQTLDG